MTVNEMRRALIDTYSERIRGRRVADMPDSQVIAIFRSITNRRAPGIPSRNRLHEPVRYEQMRMEFMND